MKSERILLATALILGLILVPLTERGQTASAAPKPIFVDVDASGANDGSSWADAYVDLQDGLSAATSGRQVWVAAGVYTPGNAGDRTATFQLKDGVSVYGGFDGTESTLSQRDWEAHVTVLSGDIDGNDATDARGVVMHTDHITGSNAYHVVTGSGTDTTAILDGFTITGGQAVQDPLNNYGGGMVNEGGSPTLTNLTFTGNTVKGKGGGISNRSGSALVLVNIMFINNTATSEGGGLYSSNSTLNMTDATFSGNSARYGGGISNHGSSPVLTNLVLNGNLASFAGGGMNNYDSDPALTNVVFSGNTTSWGGGGMYNEHGSDPVLTNVTFSANTADNGGGMYNFDDSDPDLYNCLLWSNSASSSGNQIGNALNSTPTVYHSLIQSSGGSASWDASLGTDGGGNIDADPQFVDADGADDVVGTLDDNLRLEGDSPAVDAGDNGWLVATTDLDYHARRVDMPQADTGSGSAPIVDMGAYEAHVLFANKHAPMGGANDGSSWADAYKNLHSALNAAAADTEIWVAKAVYQTDGSGGFPKPERGAVFQLKDDVALYGGFAGTEAARDQRDWETNVTVLSGDIEGDDGDDANGIVTDTANIAGSNAYHVVDASYTNSGAVLDGFTITAGHADGGATNSNGAGMYIDSGSPTLRNLVFSGNLAGGNGGGIYNTGTPTLTGVTFSGNVASVSGGGMSNYQGALVLSDVVFSDNHADTVGGGLYNFEGDVTLTNASFFGDSAGSSGGGAYSSDGNLTLTNGVFSGNTANNGGGLYNSRNNATLTNVTFGGNVGTLHGGGILAHESGAVVLANCILWQNGSQISNQVGATATVSYSLVQWGCPSGSTCDHLLSADPEFVDANGADNVYGTLDDDLHLKPNSPAIDAGNNFVVPSGITADLDGAARFVDVEGVADTGNGSAPVVDMGAYEAAFQAVYLPLVLR
jgi:predicted outer membrane repeat protein